MKFLSDILVKAGLTVENTFSALAASNTMYAGTGTRLRTEANNLVFERVSSSGIMKMVFAQGTLSPTAKSYIGYSNATLNLILANEYATGGLELRTSDVIRQQIFSNGNIVIGQASPVDAGYKVDVFGTVRASQLATGAHSFRNETYITPTTDGYTKQNSYNAASAYTMGFVGDLRFGAATAIKAVFSFNGAYSNNGTIYNGDVSLIKIFTSDAFGNPTPSANINGYGINLMPTLNYTQSTSNFTGIYYNPTLTATTGLTHYAMNLVSGLVRVGDLAGTGDRMVVANSSGVLSTQAIVNPLAVLPVGGTTGQILAKIDNTNYNTEWIDNYTGTVKHTVKAGVALTKGQAVYVSSADGTNMIVSKASNATESTSSKTMGIIAQSLSVNGTGFVVTEGLISGLDTSSAQAGDPVWLGTDGNLLFGLSNKPYAPNHLVYIGVVTRAQQNNGEIFVNVQNGFELNEIHNVQITSTPSDNTVLAYEASTSLYKMKSIATLLGYTPYDSSNPAGYISGITSNMVTTALGFTPVTNARTITINGTTFDLTADRSFSVGTVTGSGSTGYLPKWSTSTALGNSLIYDAGTSVLIGTQTPGSAKFMVYSTTADNHYQAVGSAPSLRFADTITSPTYTGIIGMATASNNFIIGAAAGDMILSNNTNSAGNFLFGTGATERMRINATTGNISINNTNNTYRLDVTGTGRFTGSLIAATYLTLSEDATYTGTYYTLGFSGNSNGANRIFGARDGSDGIYIAAATSRDINFRAGGGTTNHLNIASTGSATFSSSVTSTGLIVNGQEFYYAPANYASGGFTRLLGRNSSTGRIEGMSAADVQAFIGLSSYISGSGTTNYLPKFTGTSTIGNSIIAESGNSIGIGTASPSSFSGYTTVSVNNATNGGIYNILVNGTETARLQAYSGIFNVAAKGASTSLTFETNGSERARINASGNLSIGNTNDSFKLDVTGTGRFSDNLRVEGAAQFWFNGSFRGQIVNYGAYAGTTDWSPFFTSETSLAFGVNGNATKALNLASTGAATFSSSVTASSVTATTSINGASVNTLGTQSTFRITSNYAGSGDIPAGTLMYLDDNTYTNLGLIPSSSGTAGSKIAAVAFNGSAWRSMWEFANVSSGNPNLLLVKSGGNVGIGTTSPVSKLSLYDTGDLWLNISRGLSFVNIGVDSTGTFYNTNSNHRWLYNSGSNEAMRITSAGSVGIGTTSPGSYLLALNTSASQGINLNGTGTGGSWFLFSNSGTANGYIASAYHLFLGGSQTDFGVRAENNLCFGTGATERMRITSGGNVVVGGTNAASRFNIRGSNSNSQIEFDNFGSGVNYILSYDRVAASYRDIVLITNGSNNTIYASTSGSVGIGSSSIFHSSRLSVAGRIHFQTSSNTDIGGAIYSTWTQGANSSDYYAGDLRFQIFNAASGSYGLREAMMIDGRGFVGIGTLTPSQNLHVASSGISRMLIENTANQSTGAGIQMLVTSGGSVVGNGTIRTDNADNMQFFNAGGERVRITSGGNLLVGTTNNLGSDINANSTIRVGVAYGSQAAIIFGDAGTPYWNIGRPAGSANFRIQSYAANALEITPTGAATFSNTITAAQYIQYQANDAYMFRTSNSWGGWARNAFSIQTESGTTLASFGGYGGSGTSLAYSYIGLAYNDYVVAFNSNKTVNFASNVTTPKLFVNTTVDYGNLNIIGYDNSGINIIDQRTSTSGTFYSAITFRDYYLGANGAINFYHNQYFGSGVNRLGFAVNGTDHLTIRHNGNVGIGILSPAYRLDVRQVTTDPVAFFGFSQTSSSSNGLIKLNSGRIPQGGSDFTGESGIIFGHSGGTGGVNFDGQGGYIKSVRLNTYAASGESDSALVFATAIDNSDVERMRITSGGAVCINATATTQGAVLYANGTAAFGQVYAGNLSTGALYSNAGFITNTNPSDFRLKNNIKPLTYGLNEVLQLNPKTFYYNDDLTKARLKYGFIAQEVKDVMPDLVRRLGADTDYLGLENEGIFVTLVNAIKEQQAQINELKSQLNK